MRPEHATSPRNRIAEGSVRVIYTAPDGYWSLAEMTYDDEPGAVACRWNGELEDPDDKGNPRSHAQGTWFVFPRELGRPIAAMVKLFGNGHADYPAPRP